MKSSNRFVISSVDCLRRPERGLAIPHSAGPLPGAAVAFSSAVAPTAKAPTAKASTATDPTAMARAVQAMLCLTTLAALAQEHLGVGAALVLTIFVLPVVVLGLSVAWRRHRDGDDSALCSDALGRTFASALIAPVVALPGALLGWVGVGALILAMALALAALLSKNG